MSADDMQIDYEELIKRLYEYDIKRVVFDSDSDNDTIIDVMKDILSDMGFPNTHTRLSDVSVAIDIIYELDKDCLDNLAGRIYECANKYQCTNRWQDPSY